LKQRCLFVNASNDLTDNLSMDKILSTHKFKPSVEKVFQFLKSPDFLTSVIYLKKQERFEALLIVVTNCLMVCASLEHQMRKQLNIQNCYFPDVKKITCRNPNTRWVFQCFYGETLLYIEVKELVVNLKERQK
jgi:transposase